MYLHDKANDITLIKLLEKYNLIIFVFDLYRDVTRVYYKRDMSKVQSF